MPINEILIYLKLLLLNKIVKYKNKEKRPFIGKLKNFIFKMLKFRKQQIWKLFLSVKLKKLQGLLKGFLLP